MPILEIYRVHQGGFYAQFCKVGFKMLKEKDCLNLITRELREHAKTCHICQLPDPDYSGKWWYEEEPLTEEDDYLDCPAREE
jgi:hypothetical protein